MESNPAPESSLPPLNPPNPTFTRPHGPATIALHADTAVAPLPDVAPAIHTSTTFQYNTDPSALIPARDGPPHSSTLHVYSRHSNPNTTRLESLLSALLEAPTLTYASGLAALFAVYTLLNPRRVAITAGYHGAHGILNIFKRLTKLQIVALEDADQLGPGDVIHLETPLNPTGEARDIGAYAAIAKRTGAFVLVDATLAPPPLLDPLGLGAHIVMHSGTKYIGGHSDMLLGIVATKNEDWFGQLGQDRAVMGNVAGNLEGWLGVRSLRTLSLRVGRQSKNAEELVDWLRKSLLGDTSSSTTDNLAIGKVVNKVYHASVQAKSEDMAWLSKQMPNGYGPVFAFTMKTEDLAKRLPSKLKLFFHATSLGGVESLIEWRAMSDETADQSLLRVSVGLEDWRDLQHDLLQAIKALVEEDEKNGR